MKVILPGSYDPITLGHMSLIEYAAEKYGEVFVVGFINPDKEYSFDKEARLKMLKLATEGTPGVVCDFSEGRVVDYMKAHGIEKIIKGYRNGTDLEYEKLQAEYNLLHGGYETELVPSKRELEKISSTEARRAIAEGKSLEGILSKKVIEFIKKH